jgi:hypothetical protein
MICLAATPLSHGGTINDAFDVSNDYLVDGISGTVWDGVYFGAGEFSNTGTGGGGAGATLKCDANISTNGLLSLQTTGTAWEGVDDDGFFLYKVVNGDFSVSVRVVAPYDTTGYNTAGLQVRAFSPGGNPAGGSEDYVSWTRFDQFGFANYLRNEVNGVVTQVNPGGAPNSNYWLRIDRVNGTNFTFYQRATTNDPWALVTFPAPVSGTTVRRADFAGHPLQVGIMHATFNNAIGVQFSDFSISSADFDNHVPAPSGVTGLSIVPGTNRNADVSWTAGAGSTGTLVALWTGSDALKQRPANGFNYTGNAVYGSGSQLLATNYFVMYAGGGTNVTLTNLPLAAVCHVAVFAYDGNGAMRSYSESVAQSSFVVSGASASTSNNLIVVDPVPTGLTNVTVLGDWNTNGDFESWSVSQVAGAQVTGGVLSGTASGTDSQVSRLNFANGPDLDLGFNDYLELRIQVAADYLGDILIHYGDTFYTGITATRVLTIPSVMIPKDGAFHTYRIDVGLEPQWRGFLRDLRIDPLDASGNGKAFAIDFLRVGDLTGDVYHPRYTTASPIAGGPTNELGRPVIEMESKHFRFLWDTNVLTHANWTAGMPRGSLRNLEETWQVFAKKLGYREPSESWNPANRDGKKYKVNVSTWHSGYWAGGEAPGSVAAGRLNITPDGLRVDPPTWVIPHELMHVFQFHQRDGGQTVDGSWSEGHANYGRELWIDFYRNLFPNDSGIDANYIHSAHMIVAHGRDYYLSWPFFVYIDENPDALPDLGFGTMAKIWKENLPGVYMYTTLETLTPTTSVKDIIGYFARRQLTFDYRNQTAMTNALNGQNPTLWRRFITTELVRRADDTNWWRVPMEMAPMQGAYTIHELVPDGAGAGRVVSVNLRGLPDAARGADWRASFIVISDTGVERYSPLWNAGTNSVTLEADENRVYLSVAGTPNSVLFTGFDDLTYPYRSHGSKQRLHYEVQVTGAVPRETANGSTLGLVQHVNGGGWRSATAIVDSSAYIGPNARVLNTARVRGNARVEDFAVVRDTATVTNDAIVSGHALVMNSAVIRDQARVRDWAVVSGSAVVGNVARVLEHAQVRAGAVTNSGVAKGSAILEGGYVAGWGVIEGDFMAGRIVTNGFAFGHQPFAGVPDNWVRVAPNRQYAAYEFTATNQSMARDQIGVTDAYLVGGPQWRASDAGRSGTLGFNGTNQYVVLDKSLIDGRELSIAAWMKWDGGSSNQPAWHFGSAATNCMYFTPDGGTGNARFVFRRGGVDQILSASAALVPGAWTHVVVTLSNGVSGRLFINGTLQAEGNISGTPDALLAPNTAMGASHHYFARGADPGQPLYRGSLDSVQFYGRVLTNAEIVAMGPANAAPTLAPIGNRSINAGFALAITNVATDANLPWQTLTFNLLAAPPGAVITTNTGIVSWRPTLAQAGAAYPVSVRVADNGTPSLAATQSFNVTVIPVAAPQLSAVGIVGGQFGFQISGDPGPDYSIQSSTNLSDWSTIFTTNAPALPFNYVDNDFLLEPLRFYRVLLGP